MCIYTISLPIIHTRQCGRTRQKGQKLNKVSKSGYSDTLGIRLPIDFANFYPIVQSTSSTESYSEGFTLIASILHKIVSITVSEQT